MTRTREKSRIKNARRHSSKVRRNRRQRGDGPSIDRGVMTIRVLGSGTVTRGNGYNDFLLQTMGAQKRSEETTLIPFIGMIFLLLQHFERAPSLVFFYLYHISFGDDTGSVSSVYWVGLGTTDKVVQVSGRISRPFLPLWLEHFRTRTICG